MDGTKRKAPPYSDSIDLGMATPKWTAMTNYPVSAVRYTQDPYALPPKRRDSLQMREEAARAISPLTIDDGSSDGESEGAEFEVDTGNDGVYLLNTGESTWYVSCFQFQLLRANYEIGLGRWTAKMILSVRLPYNYRSKSHYNASSTHKDLQQSKQRSLRAIASSAALCAASVKSFRMVLF